MCQPELCTQHSVTVKGKRGRVGERGGGDSFTPFHPVLIYLFNFWRGFFSCQCRNAFLISCSPLPLHRAEIVGSRENYCQDNQTWQYPHPICKGRCAAVCGRMPCTCHVRFKRGPVFNELIIARDSLCSTAGLFKECTHYQAYSKDVLVCEHDYI